MARRSVGEHVVVLKAADPVSVMWRGRGKPNYVNAEHINAIAER